MVFLLNAWKMTRTLVWSAVIGSCIVMLGSWSFAVGSTVGIGAVWTYLYVPPNEPPGAVDAVPIELSLLGIAAGDTLRIEQLGAFNNGPAGDTLTQMIGVFSGSDVLLAPPLRYRVQDAIDAGTDFITGTAYWDGQPTDIPEDFFIDDVEVIVPTGTTHLFVTAYDTGYWDNSDPNGDLAVRLTVIHSDLTDVPPGDFPQRSCLMQNVPNPFNPQTTIAFDLPHKGNVSLRVFDVAGRIVKNLIDGEIYSAVRHEVVWNGRDDAGRQVASGTYFYRLEAGSYSETKRMVLIK